MTDCIIKMRKKLDVIDLTSEKVMIDFETGKYFVLVGSANHIWEQLGSITEFSNIITNFLKIYDIYRDKCKKEVLTFLEKLTEIGFVQLEEFN